MGTTSSPTGAAATEAGDIDASIASAGSTGNGLERDDRRPTSQDRLVEIRQHGPRHEVSAEDAGVDYDGAARRWPGDHSARGAPARGRSGRRNNFRRRVWYPAVKKVGLDGLRFHDLRHTGATLAAATGAPLRAIMAAFGHATPATALRYQHVVAGQDADIATNLDQIENALDRPARLWASRVDSAGTALVGDPVPLLTAEHAWENPLIENPAMVMGDDGRRWLFYSAGPWETARYSTGLAASDGPLRPCRKVVHDRPWSGSAGDVAGSGGLDTFVAPNGELMAGLHAWEPDAVGYVVLAA